MNKLLPIKMKTLVFIMLSLFTFSSFSCNEDDNVPEQETKVAVSVRLDKKAIILDMEQEQVVSPIFEPNGTIPGNSYSWTTSDPDVASVHMNDDYSAVVTGIKEGVTTITFSSVDGKYSASLEVSVNGPKDDGVLKILAIGNSFSEDAVENYLYDLGKAEGVKMVIGNLYIGGAPLDLHWSNAQANTAAYNYRKIDEDGTKTSTPDTSIEVGVTDENWDYISFQQVSGKSGMYETFVTPLPALLDYVQALAVNTKVKYVLHQTWAYDETSTHSDFPNYGSDQQLMYEAIVDAYRKAVVMADMDYVIPSGTAIQNGRTSLVGDNFTRDGYHLDLGIGRYTAASTWFEALTGINVIGNSYKPDAITDLEAEIAQHAAHAAISDPDKVTILTDYASGNAEPLNAAVYINFGHRIVSKWNTLADHHEGSSIDNLKDENDAYTDISLLVTQRFNDMNGSGESDVTTDFEIPSDVSTQSYYGNSSGVWQGLEIKQSQIKLSGLDPNLTYNLCFFGSRAGVSDDRETKFIVAGENTATTYVQTANNNSEIGCADGIQADANGEITITVTAGENNNNGSGFYYFGAMRLTPGQ
ncbi:DUF4886 domain-containing protein [Galbibacter sp.]|uniref:DUF4886 domain-containing protein n=1 Tax=Galbibacter sp. TaxID=2918471 RepID=UPI003A8D2D6B